MSLGPRTFAPFLAAMLVLWPIIAYMGAQGFSAAVGIAALCGLFYLNRPQIDRLTLAGAAFVIWVILAGFWGPEADGLLIGDLGSGSLSLDMPGLRFALTSLAGFGVFLALKSVSQGSSERSLKIIRGVGLVQFAGVFITAVFMAQVLGLLAPISDPVSEMPQNLMRNANAFLLLLPILLAWIWFRYGAPRGTRTAIALGALSFLAFVLTGTQTALMGFLVMLVCMAVVKRYPRDGFKYILNTLAAYVMVAPLIFCGLVPWLRDFGLPLPKSFFSRSYSWELVGEKILASPLIGHGPEASQSWRDTYGDHPEWLADAAGRYGAEFAWEVYRVIPSHPHNMSLQIWAETGIIGASLAAGFLVLLASQLKPPAEWSPISRYAAAGLIGVCLAICSFAYSMWNEAFWGSVVLASAAIFLQARHDGSVTG